MTRPVILVLRALGLGDLLTAVPALRALAGAFPGYQRVLATPAPLAPLALSAGLCDRVLCARPLGGLAWRDAAPDVAVNLHGRGPESHAVLRPLQARRTIAFAHPEAPESAGGPAWRDGEHEVARWCRLLSESGIEADPSHLDIPRPPGQALAAACGAIVLHPGAASAARRWPADRWARVAGALARQGHAVVITGSPDEVALAREVAAGAGPGAAAVLAGRTSVMDLARVVAVSSRVVSGDTGVAHLAVALGRPSVTLFGPTPPALWGPPPDRPWHRALWAGETGDPHATEPHPGLLRIQVDDVLAALATLPEAPAPTSGRLRSPSLEYRLFR